MLDKAVKGLRNHTLGSDSLSRARAKKKKKTRRTAIVLIAVLTELKKNRSLRVTSLGGGGDLW